MHRISDLPERVAAKIMPVPDGCWLWTGAANRGYGRLFVSDPSVPGRRGRTGYAHRVVYEFLVGPIQAESLDHLCRRPSCVNPSHLEPVSIKVNVLRGGNPAARRARQTECKRGHPFDEENTYIKPGGNRVCRKCRRQTQLAFYRRHPNYHKPRSK